MISDLDRSLGSRQFLNVANEGPVLHRVRAHSKVPGCTGLFGMHFCLKVTYAFVAFDLYRRYMDDCVGATSSTREELNQFITAVNSFHAALKYTWEISDTSLAFLDIKVSVDGNGLCTSVHYKPTDSHSYLLYSFFTFIYNRSSNMKYFIYTSHHFTPHGET